MSKQAQPRRYADTEAAASLRFYDSSVQKASLVLATIRGRSVEDAMADLAFSPKKAAEAAKKVLMSAVANAENNHQLNVDKLFVKEARADKGFTIKRWRARARGRVGKILKPRCHLTIVVAEKTEEKAEKPAQKPAKAAAKAKA